MRSSPREAGDIAAAIASAAAIWNLRTACSCPEPIERPCSSSAVASLIADLLSQIQTGSSEERRIWPGRGSPSSIRNE